MKLKLLELAQFTLRTSTTIKPAVLEFGMEAEDYMFDSASLSNGDTQITMYSKKGKIIIVYLWDNSI